MCMCAKPTLHVRERQSRADAMNLTVQMRARNSGKFGCVVTETVEEAGCKAEVGTCGFPHGLFTFQA
eukprot:1158216-Pelagomonas_calceolata.AAC.4